MKMKCMPVMLCLASLALAQYPQVGTRDSIYHTFDFPEAPSGDTLFWESFKWGADGSSATIRRDNGKFDFYGGQWGKVWKSQESDDSTDILGMKQATGIRTWDFFENAENVEDTGIVKNNKVFIYMMNIYKAGDGDLFGFLHIEDLRAGVGSGDWTSAHHNNESPAHTPAGDRTNSTYRIGLAHCDSESEAYPCEAGGWQFLGVILRPKHDYFDIISKKSSNIAGVPYMVKAEHIYVYFHENIFSGTDTLTRSSVARAPIAGMIAQAEEHLAGGEGSPWRKYTGGNCGEPSDNECWTEDPLTGVGGALRTEAGDMESGDEDLSEYYRDLHTDMVFSTATNRYYMPVKLDSIYLYSSEDGINWDTDPKVTIAAAPENPTYPTIIPVSADLTSDDGSRVGPQFYVMFQQTHPNDSDNVCLGVGTNCRHPSSIFRSKVTLVPPNPAARVDYDGDGISDLSVKAETEYDAEIRVDLSSNGFTGQDDVLPVSFLSGVNDIAVPADYDGDGLTDYSGKSEGGDWAINYAVDGIGYSGWNYYYRDGSSQTWGDADCVPVPADYDGDGKADLSVFCKELYSSVWDIDFASDGFTGVDGGRQSGVYFTNTHHPVPADYNGDGKADLAFKDDVLGSWHIDLAPDFGGWEHHLYGFGGDTGIAVPADYNGDDTTDLSIFSRSSGTWYIDTTWGNGHTLTSWNVSFNLGWSGFTPAPGDYDGDGKADLAAKDDSSGDWHVDYSSNGFGATDTIFEGWEGGQAHPLYKKPAREELTLSHRGGQILLSFALLKASKVQVHAYTADGKRAAALYDANLPEGRNHLSWNRQDLAAKGLKRGLYFISLRADGYKASKRLMLAE